MRNAFHALKSLNYFNDVETADWPEIIKEKELTWGRIKEVIDSACNKCFITLRHENL